MRGREYPTTPTNSEFGETMKKPSLWFAPIYGLLIALVISVVCLGSVTAKSSKQNTTQALLCDVEGVLNSTVPLHCPKSSQRLSQLQQQNNSQEQFLLYCFNQDAIAAANHVDTAVICKGIAP